MKNNKQIFWLLLTLFHLAVSIAHAATNRHYGGAWQRETEDPRCTIEKVIAGPGNPGVPEFDAFCERVKNTCRCKCQAISDLGQIVQELSIEYSEVICMESRPCKGAVQTCCMMPDIPCNFDPWGGGIDPCGQSWIPPRWGASSECSPYGEPIGLPPNVPFIFLGPWSEFP